MLFNSVNFLIFLPIVVLFYYLLPNKIRLIWLLVASYFFYMCWNPKYVVLLLVCTLSSYLCAILVAKFKTNKSIKLICISVTIFINIGILFFFKYFNFVIGAINNILSKTGISILDVTFDIVLPIGISFYIFKSVSYIIDVYREKISPEKNICKYALYISFFPQIASGPIERADKFISQLTYKHKFDGLNVKKGMLLMLWGFFQKLVIADRIAVVVNYVYANYSDYAGFTLFVVSVLFSIQIYCDFAGYSNISIGVARIMGFKTINNFERPYFSRSIQEFWRRWHISLSLWFRDYLYIPLGGNRCSKIRKYFNLMVTFLVSGLWHGASFNYIVWGGLHGLYQIIGDLLKPLRKKIIDIFNINTQSFAHKLFQCIFTFLLVDIAWIFFRAPGIRVSFDFIIKMFSEFNPWILNDGTLYTLGLSENEFIFMIISIIVLFAVSLLQRKMNILVVLDRQPIWFRWIIYFTAIFSVILFGIYGSAFNASNFIYLQF